MLTTENHKWFKVVGIKISFEHDDSCAKSLLFRTHHLWNSTTELTLYYPATFSKTICFKNFIKMLLLFLVCNFKNDLYSRWVGYDGTKIYQNFLIYILVILDLLETLGYSLIRWTYFFIWSTTQENYGGYITYKCKYVHHLWCFRIEITITLHWTIYSATTFLESCRKVVQEKWVEKSGSRNLVR